MGTESRAVIDVFRCIDHIEKRRKERWNDLSQSASLDDDSGRRKRRSQAADNKLRERYYDILQGRDKKSTPSERIRTLRKMVLAQGLPEDAELLCDTKVSRDQSHSGEGEVGGDSASAKINADAGADVAQDSDPPDECCSLRGLVWKVLLGTIHIDAALYVSLVARGPSAEDVKIREDTFRTFQGDAEFRRRVNEDKLSRINNAFVRLNSLTATAGAGERSGAAGAGGSDATGNFGNNDGESGGSATGSSKAGKGGVGAGCGKGVYVQGMMVLCAPLLFVMPEVDAFFAFNSLLNDHMPRYVAANLDGVHAGCALVDRALSVVDPALFNYLESKFVTANIYAFPLLMSLHACVPPLEETIKLWDAVFSFGVHLEVLICVAQCVSLRETLLQDPNPYQHVNYRNLPPLDAELLVAMAFSLIPHLPPGLMNEIARHPFLDDEKPGEGREWLESIGSSMEIWE